jgi:hypothetical protein
MPFEVVKSELVLIDGVVWRMVTRKDGMFVTTVHSSCFGSWSKFQEDRPDLVPQVIRLQREIIEGVAPEYQAFSLEKKDKRHKSELEHELAKIDNPQIVRVMMDRDHRELAQIMYIRRLEELIEKEKKEEKEEKVAVTA